MGRPSKPWLRKASQTWVVKLHGRLYTLGTDKADALEEFHRLKAKQSLGEPTARADTTLADLVAGYLAYQESRITPGCLKSYHRYLTLFARKFGKSRLASTVDPDEVKEWIDSRPKWGQTTRNCAVRRIKAAYRHAKRKGWIAGEPLATLQGPGDRARQTALSPEQYKILMAQPEIRGGLRDLLQFLWETGCRPSEAYRLKAIDIDFHVNIASIVGKTTKKTGKPRVIYLSEVAIGIVRRQRIQDNEGRVFVNRDGQEWTWNSVFARLNPIRRRLGWGDELTPSGFRRGFGTEGALHLTPHALGELMGNSAQTVNKFYVNLNTRQKEMHDALGKVRSRKRSK